ncbi:MAG: hypothetical protein OXC28_08820 [Defluviicoccus sp.]|nr:hypothetical protein [Defluviicoccus sp.]
METGGTVVVDKDFRFDAMGLAISERRAAAVGNPIASIMEAGVVDAAILHGSRSTRPVVSCIA